MYLILTNLRGNHVLDIDEGVLPSVNLENFEGLVDEVSEVEPLALAVVHQIAEIHVVVLEDVEDREDLAVIPGGKRKFSRTFMNHNSMNLVFHLQDHLRHQRFSDHFHLRHKSFSHHLCRHH